MVKQRKVHAWKVFFLVLLFNFLLSTTVWASDTGSLQFHFPKGAAGLQITVYKIAEYDLESFTYTEDFKENPENLLQFQNAEEMQEAADTLQIFAKERKRNGISGTVSEEGKITFSGMEDGLYLICQTGDHSRYEMLATLIAVPYRYETGEITNEVEVYPKIEEKPENVTVTPTPTISSTPSISPTPTVSPTPEQKPGKSVKTGDDTPIEFYAGLCLVALVVCGAVYRKKRNEP